MATTTPNIAAQWKALNPDQRKLAMSKMTGEQKTKLATALGFKGDQTQKTTMADILNPRDPSAVEKPGPNPMDPREAVNAFENIGAGLLTPIVHPVETAKGAFRMSPLGMALDLKNGRETAPEEMAKQFVDNPYGTIESGIGMAAVLGGAEEAAGAVPGTAGNVARMLTKTGPKETEELVKETKAGNEAATAKAAEETAKQNAKHAEDVAKAADKRKVDLREHFEKTQDTKAANAAKEAPVARREALDRGVERLDTEARGDLKNLEKKVHDAADQRYKDLRATLADEEADPYQPANEEGRAIGEPVTMVEHLYDVASTPLRGTETETPIIKSLAKRTEQGDVGLTYNDLQGYREEVGRELRKGTLPPDVYTSYKGLMGAIDDAMEGIAKRHGLLDQQKAARAGWRQYADTFLDRDSPFRKWKTAADSPNYKPGMGVSYIRNADTGIQAIAKYDPELAARLNNLRNSAAEAKALPAKPGKLGSLPE